MQITLRIALIILTLVYIGIIIKAIKNKKIQVSFSIFWIFTGLVLIVALAIPNVIVFISHILGFELTTNMIFCVTIFIAFYLIFNLNIMLAKETKKNIVLIQEISIMKNTIQQLEEKMKNAEGKDSNEK